MPWGCFEFARFARRYHIARRLRGLVAATLLAAPVAACSSNEQLPSRFTASGGPAASGPTIAFESIDGPPPEVFRKLVASMNAEAATRNIAVVSRTASANYRVRGYMSAMVEGNKTSFGWVWDIYDADKRRALRIAGEEPVTGRQRDAWSAADDQVLRGMAENGMTRVAAFLDGSERAPSPAPAPGFMTLASGRNDTPEAAGIVQRTRIEPTTDGRAASRP